MSSVLLIFVKNPRLGSVKTRLARTVGDAEALRIYHLLLEKTRTVTLEVPVERWLYYSAEIETEDAWAETEFKKMVQQGADLGARMARAFEQAFDAGATKVAIIGSDCPEISSVLLKEAFARLEESDFVMGPSLDGGYYLLGMRFFAPSVFQGIRWSTDTVGADTMRKIEDLGKTIFLLPSLSDVDTEEDWRNAVC